MHNRFSTFILQICPWGRYFSTPILLCMLCAVSASAQRPFSNLDVDSLDNPYPGYYLFAPNSYDSLGLIDHSGRVVVRFEVGPHANPRSDRPELISHFAVLKNRLGSVFAFVIRNSSNQVLDTIYPSGRLATDFHEGRIWSDTSFLILSQRTVPYDLSTVRPGGNSAAMVIEAVIQEIANDGRVIFEWRSLDHVSPSAATDDEDFTLDVIDYIHVNGVERDTDGNLLVSCRHIDAVLKIDRITGKVIWALGGSASKINQFTFVGDSAGGFRGFSHQHSAFRTSRGTLMLFDNGNVKPPAQRSRIVEYELDEQAKVARRIWQYIPEPPIFVTTMGSVSELPNGRLLIGYGTRTSADSDPGRVLEEIDREGRVDARMSYRPFQRLTPYRVSKVQIGMTGFRRSVLAPTFIGHAVGDSTTNLDINITSVASSTAIVVEKHHYAPHELTYDGQGPCVVAPYRWIIRSENPRALTGNVKLLARGLRFVDVADAWQLRWRAREGSGRFSTVAGVNFDERDSSWTVPTLADGEYALVSASCIMPSPIFPADDVVVSDARPKLVFSRAAGASAYEIQVATTASFAEVVYAATVPDTQATLPSDLRSGVSMFWRVRRLLSGRPGLWSHAARFSVLPTSPVLIAPRSERDTAGVPRNANLRWASYDRARSYRVVVTDLVLGAVMADTVVEDTVLPLPPALAATRAYGWSVRANTDTGTTKASFSFFGTLPEQPWLIQPEPSVYLDASKPVGIRFRRVPDTDSAEVIVGLVRAGTVGAWPLLGLRTSLAGLPTDQDLLISVRVRGRYGWRESDVRRVRLVQPAPLEKPERIQPLDGDFVPVGAMATFEWQPVDGATSYHLQATDWVAFDRLTVDTVVSTTMVLKQLAQRAPYLQWRVQPRFEGAIGPWSDTAHVNLRGSSALALVAVTPKFGARAVATSGAMVVSNRTGYPRLEVEVGTDPYLDDGVRVIECIDSVAVYSALATGVVHYWRPVASGSDSTKIYGPTSLFVSEGVAGFSEDGETSYASVWYDGSLHGIVVRNPLAAPCIVTCYSYDGRQLISTAIASDRGFIDLPPEFVIPAVVFVRVCDGSKDDCRFFTVAVR